MTCRRCLPALFVLTLVASESHAQFYCASPYGYGASFHFSRFRAPLGFSLSLGGYSPSPFLLPVSKVTVVYTSPVVVVRPITVVVEPSIQREFPELIPSPVPEERRAAPRANIRPPQPDNRARPRAPAPAPKREELPPPKEMPPEEKPKPAPQRKAKEPADLPRPPMPEGEPNAENARLIEVGLAAFAAGEYGRAAERFRQAAAIAPERPRAYFLLAQAWFALGKYHLAVDAVQTGLLRAPDWPVSGFRPLELYGPNVAEYSEHLRLLAEVLRADPNNPDLLFLNACLLWFDGRRDEARVFFERARRHGANPAAIDSFLKALPEGPVV
jgi:hypothetical protein